MPLTLSNDFANGDALDADLVQENFEEIEAKFSASVGTTDLAADAVTSAKVADDAIDTEHIADDAIVAAHIDDDAVGTAAIADDAIDSQHYTDASIDWAHLADETPNIFYAQYDGDGTATQEIDGCPFQPTFAAVVPLEAYSGLTMMIKHSSMAGANAVLITTSAVTTTGIVSLDADGITVGLTCNTLNKSALAIMFRTKS